MTKLYFRLRWGMYFYQRTHPLVTPGVWVAMAFMVLMFIVNVTFFVTDTFTGHNPKPSVTQTRVVKEFFRLPDSKGIVNLTLDVNQKDK